MSFTPDLLATTIAAGPPARLVRLFGSTANGELRSDSDVDIAWLPVDTNVSLGLELQFQAQLTRAAGREVDLVRLDRASTLCRYEVARSGLPLAGDRNALVRFRGEAIGEYLDFEPALRAATERYRQALLAGVGRGDPMTDPAIVLRKLAALRDHVERLRRRRPAAATDLQNDLDLQDALAMSLLVAVQTALDIAMHFAADRGLGIPATYAEAFTLLAQHGICCADTSAGLARMAALRNRIAHGYAGVDFARIWAELPGGIQALDRFAVAIGMQLGPG